MKLHKYFAFGSLICMIMAMLYDVFLQQDPSLGPERSDRAACYRRQSVSFVRYVTGFVYRAAGAYHSGAPGPYRT